METASSFSSFAPRKYAKCQHPVFVASSRRQKHFAMCLAKKLDSSASAVIALAVLCVVQSPSCDAAEQKLFSCKASLFACRNVPARYSVPELGKVGRGMVSVNCRFGNYVKLTNLREA
ncbi:hypothetical protein BaRGS_00019903 [Batillaria attramentaria]|uniref:Uncharacterized protein n=1 Tax=Batillaria attramentaria TaxID=370345 RepID=A0ABD0KNF5_9CAEN